MINLCLFQESDAMVSLTDIVPTVLDWFGINYPTYKLLGKPVQLTGKSLLPVLVKEPPSGFDTVFASHNLHEVTMYYPMRVVRNRQFKLIQNINYKMPFGIDEDFYLSDSFQDLLNRTRKGVSTHWFKTLKEYYYRSPWELYNLSNDPKELKNLYKNSKYQSVFKQLKGVLNQWQNVTYDPWICAPGAVLQDAGAFKSHPQCLGLDNDVDSGYHVSDEL